MASNSTGRNRGNKGGTPIKLENIFMSETPRYDKGAVIKFGLNYAVIDGIEKTNIGTIYLIRYFIIDRKAAHLERKFDVGMIDKFSTYMGNDEATVKAGLL